MRSFVLYIVILLIGFGSNAQTTISFQPSTLNITSTGQFSVDVWINNAVNITAASITVNFNSDRISYNSTAQGNFLYGAAYFVTPPSAGNPNSILVDQAILGGASVSGSGKVFTIYFTPKSPGNDILTISAASLKMPGGAQIPFTSLTCNISINIPILVSAKVLLQGCYNLTSSNMNNILNSNYLIPLNQPFSGPPWNYSGTESVTTSFFKIHRNIVDWILVELRTGLSGSTLAARKALFLLQDGTIINLDGESSAKFNIPSGNYYLVIKHRNHLGIMSSSPIPLTITASSWDFSTSVLKAYGNNSMVALASNVFGMISGDGNADNFIDISDYIGIDNSMFQSGYLRSDINMDGFIDISDYINIDNNMFKGSGVPE
ncbi:MAG: cohesin domain-containing protein [Bacteroidota bacterium]|nr:cohesin domain-containing protein [Bacteroidota bacterium]